MTSKNKLIKKSAITCGALALLMFAPANKNLPVDNPFMIEAQAAETYSDNWKIDSNQTWWYYLNDGSLAKNCWIEDHGQWYLLDSSGAMRTGVVKSNGGKYYLLDTVRGTGYYGRMLQNGNVYRGITIKAEASGDSVGALSEETLNQLRGLGENVDGAINVENTNHVSGGNITLKQDQNTQQNQGTGNTGTDNTGGDIWAQFRDREIYSNGGAANIGGVGGEYNEKGLESIANGLRGA